jgi:hypothetical protein
VPAGKPPTGSRHSMKLCQKPIAGRSKFESYIKRCCSKEAGHNGPCEEYPYLSHMSEAAPRVAAKIVRDSTKTTGAAWKSAVAGPNRMDRWGMLSSISDQVLKERFAIDLVAMGPSVQSKLREKAATYEDCMAVAAKLTWAAYQMRNAPEPTIEVAAYLSRRFSKLEAGTTRCIVCRDSLNFDDFEGARRGRALIETAHSSPRAHNPENVGFAHRDCNIAQGGRSLVEFYQWIRSIIARVDAGISAEVEAPGSHSSTS